MAASLVQAAAAEAQADGGRPVSLTALETVTDAVAQDLGAHCANVTEAFIAKVETHTGVLAEAAIQLSDAAKNLASAIKAVKEEM